MITFLMIGSYTLAVIQNNKQIIFTVRGQDSGGLYTRKIERFVLFNSFQINPAVLITEQSSMFRQLGHYFLSSNDAFEKLEKYCLAKNAHCFSNSAMIYLGELVDFLKQ